MPAAYERHDTACARPSSATAVSSTRPSATPSRSPYPTPPAVSGRRSTRSERSRPNPGRYPEPLRVRMALHSGPSTQPAMAITARRSSTGSGRLLGAAHGDQVLVSQARWSWPAITCRRSIALRPRRAAPQGPVSPQSASGNWRMPSCAPTSRRRAPSTPARTTLPTQLT